MLSRRQFLAFAGGLALGGLVAHFRLAWAAAKEWSLDEFAKNIQSGGPPKDGIPPIERPKYVSAAEAEKFLKPKDIVFGLDYRGVVKAYPQKILVWHEIVNEQIAGEKLSITYCPLTGSVVGFRGRSKGGEWLTFGTSGKLVNSNLLMYDRQTNSEWPQILGVAISGPNKGATLEEIPLAWTNWSRWQKRHPNSQVLSTETGFFRSYGRDPYGSYERQGTYYDSAGPFFPIMAQDNRFSPKQVVVGIKADGRRLAIPKENLRAKKFAQASLGKSPLVALYDPDIDAVSVYFRRAQGKDLTFRSEDGRIVDEQTQSVWKGDGRAAEGKLAGARLKQVPSFDVMWFAWYAFFPETQVLS
ncbi:MAG: DUF3179 domain-containing (seleno)protein [Candidatus Binatia bacterium]